ncbi:cytochrome c family protein, partial [Tautonia rosea]|uniref:hypothetical protein n=1 Tax=Tautonia rosea TaxID=2728037 RepID=UPI0014749E63
MTHCKFRVLSSCPLLALVIALMSGTLWASDESDGPLDLGPEDVAPGLIAVYRSVDGNGPALHRVDAKPAFALSHSSPHPRIPDGPFEVEWDGVLLVNDTGPITFHAFLGGELEMVVDGVSVLRGIGHSDTNVLESVEPLSKPPGRYRVWIRYRSLKATPARLQIHWEGPTFAPEPLPAWRLSHLVERITPELTRDQKAMAGREAIGRFGCARCHQGALPGVDDPPPGPSLADAGRRLDRDWLMHWLDDPARTRAGARMPALFAEDRTGEVERWILADLLGRRDVDRADNDSSVGDHRAGRRAFLSIGCVACHLVPDQDQSEQPNRDRFGFEGLADRMSEDDLVSFLGNPHARYPDGRMPRLPVSPTESKDITAYLLMWSPSLKRERGIETPTPEEIRAVARRLGVRGGGAEVATALMTERGCMSCHPGLGLGSPRDIPFSGKVTHGCLERIGDDGPRYTLDDPTHDAITAYLAVASMEIHPSPFDTRQRHLSRVGCVRCHQRDTDRPPPIEEVSRTLGGAYLQVVPYQRTPRLTDPHEKLTPAYLAGAVREGVSGLRSEAYTFRMPAFGPDA